MSQAMLSGSKLQSWTLSRYADSSALHCECGPDQYVSTYMYPHPEHIVGLAFSWSCDDETFTKDRGIKNNIKEEPL